MRRRVEPAIDTYAEATGDFGAPLTCRAQAGYLCDSPCELWTIGLSDDMHVCLVRSSTVTY